jgi:NTP pyrophosphatase (non-canonical NTP hydrolase)
MQLSDYQKLAQRTARTDHPARAAIAGLGLGGEAGEVQELLKKHHGHGHDLDVSKLAKELGDVLWYVAEIAACHGLDLDDVAEANIAKLKARYPEGFSSAASVARVDLGGAE